MSPLIPRIPLSEVCEVNPRDVNDLAPDTPVTFVPMSAVDEKTGAIVTPEIRHYKDVAKGYTPFRDKDVLFAKITPCMENGKCAIARGLENGWGFGSTEFHILRASDKIVPEWVYYFLRQNDVRKFAANNMTGTAGQQRVPKSVFDRLLIPLPPLPIQKQIAAILEKTDVTQEKRRKANRLTEKFLQSAFLEMFGDPVTNPKGWHSKKLSWVTEIYSGSTPSTKRSEYFGGEILWVTPKDLSILTSVYIFDTATKISKLGYDSCSTTLLPAGTVLLSSRAPIGLIAVAGKAICTNQGFKSFVCKEGLNNLFLYQYLKLITPQIQHRGHGATFKEITKENIGQFEVYIPPDSEQQKFAALVDKIELLRAKQRESEKELEDLFNSLMQKAFKGEWEK